MCLRTISGVRCRINIFQTLRGVAMAVRALEFVPKQLACLQPASGFEAADGNDDRLDRRIGTDGKRKIHDPAALVEEINSSAARNIIAIESPLEYVFTNRRSFIRQRKCRRTRRATSRRSSMPCAKIPTCS